MIYQAKGVCYDDNNRRHTFSLESDRSDRSFIASLVEARYPTSKVIINSVTLK